MYVLLIILFVTSIQAQSQCSCSCCLGQYCSPVIVGTVNVQNCSSELCLAQCRCTYSQCAAMSSTYGQVLSQCVTPVYTLYNCRCLCCNGVSVPCTPMYVGLSSSYQCTDSACGVACANQYPSQCVTNMYGQILGSCVGTVTTTTAMTTIAPWLGYLCSCLYCPSGYTCTSNTIVGTTSVSQCSSAAECTSACQNHYPSTCTTTYLGQIYGVCLSQGSTRTKCKCNCCGNNGCLDYDINTNDTCTSCYARCQQLSPCASTRPITYTCTAQCSLIHLNLPLLVIILIFSFTFLN